MLLRTPSKGATPFSWHHDALMPRWGAVPPAQRLVGKEPAQRTEASLHGLCFLHQWEGTILVFFLKRKQTLRDYFQHRGQFPQVSLIHASQSLWTLRQTLRWEEPETLSTGAGLKGSEVFSKEPFILRKPDSEGGLHWAPTLLGT